MQNPPAAATESRRPASKAAVFVRVFGLACLTFLATILSAGYLDGISGVLNVLVLLRDILRDTRRGIRTVLTLTSDFTDYWLTSYRVFYVLLAGLSGEFMLGWIFIPEEMREMTTAVLMEVCKLGEPLTQAAVAVFEVFTNPWNLVGYLFLFLLLRVDEGMVADLLLKAAERAQRIA
jgi:hypothetical protein